MGNATFEIPEKIGKWEENSEQKTKKIEKNWKISRIKLGKLTKMGILTFEKFAQFFAIKWEFAKGM